MRNTRQRRQKILQQLIDHGQVHVSDLSGEFQVSPVTIRTDLNHLQEQGMARRSHGGARLLRAPLPERALQERDTLELPLKTRIGASAAQRIVPGQNIIIDSGSTTMALARQLHAHRDLRVMTNGLNIAWELAQAPGVTLLLTGGVLDKASLSFRGAQAEASLGGYNFDTLFLGADGLDVSFGLTTHDESEASLNHRMVERARQVVVLADSSKFGKVALHRIARLDEIDVVITDPGASQEDRERLRQQNVEVIIVDEAD